MKTALVWALILAAFVWGTAHWMQDSYEHPTYAPRPEVRESLDAPPPPREDPLAALSESLVDERVRQYREDQRTRQIIRDCHDDAWRNC